MTERWTINVCPDCSMVGFVPDHGHAPPEQLEVVPASTLQELQDRYDRLAGLHDRHVVRLREARTASGKPITDELIADLAEVAEAGYDVEEILRRREQPEGESDA